MTQRHPADCNHCASIRGDRNPSKRPEVRAKISAAASTPHERARRSEAVRGARNPRFSVEGSISAAHLRVTAERGPAWVYLCVEGCERQAQEWALNKESTEIELAPPNIRGLIYPYSMNIADYDPLCKSCHRKRDRPPVRPVDLINDQYNR